MMDTHNKESLSGAFPLDLCALYTAPVLKGLVRHFKTLTANGVCDDKLSYALQSKLVACKARNRSLDSSSLSKAARDQAQELRQLPQTLYPFVRDVLKQPDLLTAVDWRRRLDVEVHALKSRPTGHIVETETARVNATSAAHEPEWVRSLRRREDASVLTVAGPFSPTYAPRPVSHCAPRLRYTLRKWSPTEDADFQSSKRQAEQACLRSCEAANGSNDPCSATRKRRKVHLEIPNPRKTTESATEPTKTAVDTVSDVEYGEDGEVAPSVADLHVSVSKVANGVGRKLASSPRFLSDESKSKSLSAANGRVQSSPTPDTGLSLLTNGRVSPNDATTTGKATTGSSIVDGKKPSSDVLCKFWKAGRCTKKDACPFKHEGDPDVCRFFVRDGCIVGEKCPFVHDKKKAPCKYFHYLGGCRRKECAFGHEGFTPEELQRFKELYVDELKPPKDKEQASDEDAPMSQAPVPQPNAIRTEDTQEQKKPTEMVVSFGSVFDVQSV